MAKNNYTCLPQSLPVSISRVQTGNLTVFWGQPCQGKQLLWVFPPTPALFSWSLAASALCSGTPSARSAPLTTYSQFAINKTLNGDIILSDCPKKKRLDAIKLGDIDLATVGPSFSLSLADSQGHPAVEWPGRAVCNCAHGDESPF